MKKFENKGHFILPKLAINIPAFLFTSLFFFFTCRYNLSNNLTILFISLIKGVLFGCFFGIKTSSVFHLDYFIGKIQMNLEPGENILSEFTANRVIGIQSVPGRLSLSNRYLRFKPLMLSSGNREIKVHISNIGNVELLPVFLSSKGALEVYLNESNQFFIVDDNAKLLKVLLETIKHKENSGVDRAYEKAF